MKNSDQISTLLANFSEGHGREKGHGFARNSTTKKRELLVKEISNGMQNEIAFSSTSAFLIRTATPPLPRQF